MSKKKTTKRSKKKAQGRSNIAKPASSATGKLKKPSSNKSSSSKSSSKKSSRKKPGRKKQRKKVTKKSMQSNSKRSQRFALVKSIGFRVAVVSLIVLLGITAVLDIKIRQQFEGQKWALPAHVYTRPMELYIGQQVDREVVTAELNELGYQKRADISRVGSYSLTEQQLAIHQRPFQFWDAFQRQQQLIIALNQNTISQIQVIAGDGRVSDEPIVRLEPRLFGSVSPLSHEDRSLLKLEDVPPELVQALIATEDQQFFSHFGINPFNMVRAVFRNIWAGRITGGGSTLTQQLVKNYYLTEEQTIKRKFIEMIMAVLLEVHYSKDEILQAYLNEIPLAQVGNRAIHGFELGSQHYFGRPLAELDLPDFAMLVGMLKGPSRYNPLRNPERAQARRNVVLKAMLELDMIDEQRYQQAIASDLHVNGGGQRRKPSSYPSFLGLVREDLKDDYQQQDLLNDGLRIYTTLNPRIQQALEQVAREELDNIEKARRIEAGSLQVAAVVIRTDNGEVAAMIGDRRGSMSGYNRALKARRPVGSLIKPFVYLTALESPEYYSLATPVSDRNITVSQRGSPDWTPKNYDGKEHGSIMLVDALAHSYNLATVRLGMQVGVENVANTVRRLTYISDIQELPSLLLGAVPMSVLDVGQMYLSLASGGFKTPIKSIRSVLSNDNVPLARYPLDIEQVVEPQFSNLIGYALQEVVRSGTARSIKGQFSANLRLAGKTGTTDDYRDSWFAGFSGNYVMVVWVGRDDNGSTGLTGASGAARLWAKTMQQLPLEPVELPFHQDILTQSVYYSRDANRYDCSLSRELPVLVASLPLERLPCGERMQYDFKDDEEDKYFEPRKTKPRKPKSKSFWERIFG